MLVGGFMEFILGNTFPFVVFMSFGKLLRIGRHQISAMEGVLSNAEIGIIIGSFYLTYGSTLQPFYGAYGLYSPSDPSAGLKTPAFNASFCMSESFLEVIQCFRDTCC